LAGGGGPLRLTANFEQGELEVEKIFWGGIYFGGTLFKYNSILFYLDDFFCKALLREELT